MTCRLCNIFDHQFSLTKHYALLEFSKNPLAHQCIPVKLDEYHAQAKLRNIAWHLTEEMAEANELIQELCENPHDRQKVHALKEELIDVFTFATELAILCGIRSPHLVRYSLAGATPNPEHDCLEILCPGSGSELCHVDDFEELLFTFNHHTPLGLAMNKLNNRAWKQSPKPTPVEEFKTAMIEALLNIYYHVGSALGHDELFHLYEKKHNINLRRIADGY